MKTLTFDPSRTCIANPFSPGSQFWQFSCGMGAFIKDDVALPKNCPFCGKPVNSLTVPAEGEE